MTKYRFDFGQLFAFLTTDSISRDGLPFCLRDYNAQFGVRCHECDKFIAGKVLQVRTKHFILFKFPLIFYLIRRLVIIIFIQVVQCALDVAIILKSEKKCICKVHK